MYKHYARLNSLLLPAPTKPNGDLFSLIQTRKSYRDFSRIPIDQSTLSDILYYSVGITHVSPKDKKILLRAYPSAGAKLPLEVYPLVRYGTDIQPGLYHYQPLIHTLDILLSPVLDSEVNQIWMSQPWFRDAAAIMIFTAVYRRSTDKYGEVGLAFPFIEAGHAVQNIYLVAQALGMGCCAIGQMNEEGIVKLLDIDTDEEFPVYYVAIGKWGLC